MKLPWALGEPLAPKIWAAVRDRAIFECCKWDIQSEDHCVLADFPLILEGLEWERLAGIAERLAVEAIAAERELAARPDLHTILRLPTKIRKAMARCDGSSIPSDAARVMRFDFHFTTEGWRISEANTDVPGGFIEASGFTRLMAEHFSDCQAACDVGEAYAQAIGRVAGEGATVGLVHATSHSDDRQVMQYLAKILERLGMHAVLLSPVHLQWNAARAELFHSLGASRPSVLVRFFPAEWLPLLDSADVWTPWFCGGKTPMSNPGTALLTQSKRFPLSWETLRCSLAAWRSVLPETINPPGLPEAAADEWVYKPVLGRVGEDIAMAGVTPEKRRQELMKDVRRHPNEWVVQRRFESVPTETAGGPRHICLGIFTIDGRASGIYGRISAKPLIDQDSQDIAVLIGPKEERDAVR